MTNEELDALPEVTVSGAMWREEADPSYVLDRRTGDKYEIGRIKGKLVKRKAPFGGINRR